MSSIEEIDAIIRSASKDAERKAEIVTASLTCLLLVILLIAGSL